MICPKCKLEGRISATRYVVKNDNDPEKETELYVEQDMICVNKNCENNEKVFDTVSTPLKLG